MNVHDFSKRAPLNPPLAAAVKIPTCPLCRNQGFTGCQEAILPSDHPVHPNGTLMSLALSKGVACTCPAGQEFARWQIENLRYL